MKKKNIRKFCRLYKYTCITCQKIRHKRHFAKQGETLCPSCEKQENITKNQVSLFDQINENNKGNGGGVLA